MTADHAFRAAAYSLPCEIDHGPNLNAPERNHNLRTIRSYDYIGVRGVPMLTIRLSGLGHFFDRFTNEFFFTRVNCQVTERHDADKPFFPT